MKHYIFFDTETTCFTEDYGDSVKSTDDILIQMAYIIVTPEKNYIVKERLCNSKAYLHPKAMAVHGITPEMIQDLEPITSYPEYTFLKEYIQNNECICIAHNAKFDIDVLKRVDIDMEKHCDVIDTLRLAKVFNDYLGLIYHNNTLQYLKYEHSLYRYREKMDAKLGIDIGNKAHNALSDIVDLLLYFQFIKKEYSASDEHMIALSNTPNTLKYVPNGSNKGKLWSELSKNSLKWYFENYDDIDVRHTVSQYL